MERIILGKVFIGFESDLLLARDMARRVSGLLGMSSYHQTAMGTAVSEMVRGLLGRSEQGEVAFQVVASASGTDFLIEVRGKASSPASAEQAASGMVMESARGMGMDSLRNLADSFEVVATKAGELVLSFAKRLPQKIPAELVERVKASVTVKEPRSLIEELQLQNQHLIETLEHLQVKQEELIEVQNALKRSNLLLSEANSLLQSRATRDPLTGLFNRLKFNELVEIELQRAFRYKQPLSLIVFDIDHFKTVNDSRGHAEGDNVLTEIADLVSVNIREGDLLFRWGGEEFVILTLHCDGDEAAGLAEKLRGLIDEYRFGITEVVTCSFGVAALLLGDDRERLFRRADEALYRAKQGGRNRVEMAQSL